MTEKNGYVTVKIPKDLSKPLDGLIGKYGFKKRAEIVKEACRRLLLEYAGLMPKAGD